MPPGSNGSIPAGPGAIGLGEACAVWLRIGVFGFGGPAGQIALMHRTVGGVLASLLFLFGAPFPLIVVSAGLLGLIGGWQGWRVFAPPTVDRRRGITVSVDRLYFFGASTSTHSAPRRSPGSKPVAASAG